MFPEGSGAPNFARISGKNIALQRQSIVPAVAVTVAVAVAVVVAVGKAVVWL